MACGHLTCWHDADGSENRSKVCCRDTLVISVQLSRRTTWKLAGCYWRRIRPQHFWGSSQQFQNCQKLRPQMWRPIPLVYDEISSVKDIWQLVLRLPSLLAIFYPTCFSKRDGVGVFCYLPKISNYIPNRPHSGLVFCPITSYSGKSCKPVNYVGVPATVGGVSFDVASVSLCRDVRWR